MTRGIGRIAMLAAVLAMPAAASAARSPSLVRQDTGFSTPLAAAKDTFAITPVMQDTVIVGIAHVAMPSVAFTSEHRNATSIAAVDSVDRARRVELPAVDSHSMVNPASLSIGLRLRTIAWAVRHPKYAYCWLRYDRPYSAVYGKDKTANAAG